MFISLAGSIWVFMVLSSSIEDSEKYRRSPASHSSCCATRTAPASLRRAAGLGKTPTTSVRRRISRLSLSSDRLSLSGQDMWLFWCHRRSWWRWVVRAAVVRAAVVACRAASRSQPATVAPSGILWRWTSEGRALTSAGIRADFSVVGRRSRPSLCPWVRRSTVWHISSLAIPASTATG